MVPIKDNIPTKNFPIITVLLIVVNIAIFLYEINLEEHRLEEFIYQYGLLPTDLMELDLFSLLSHMFLHGSFGHIIGNMLFLWVFGNNVEDVLGKLNFVVFYVISGLGSALLQSVVSLLSGNSDVPMIGASGAISGILAAYVRLFPYGKILAVIPPFIFVIFTLPAWFFIGYWFVLQILYSIFIPVELGGVAWYAHIGGFITGWYIFKLFTKG